MITIASALVPNGCDVIASLPQVPPPATRGYHLPPENVSYFCTFAQAAGRFALLHLTGAYSTDSITRAIFAAAVPSP